MDPEQPHSLTIHDEMPLEYDKRFLQLHISPLRKFLKTYVTKIQF